MIDDEMDALQERIDSLVKEIEYVDMRYNRLQRTMEDERKYYDDLLNRAAIERQSLHRYIDNLTRMIVSGKAFEPPPMLLKNADGSFESLTVFANRMKKLGVEEFIESRDWPDGD